MSLYARTTRCLAAGLTGIALAAPAARAESDHFPQGIREYEKQALASRGLAAPTPPLKANRSAPTLPAVDDGFDWTSAGVGAGAVGGLIVLAAGVGMSRRVRVSSRPQLS